MTAGAVILATGASGRLGLLASGYLYGTYENPTNAGIGHSMAYHAGAELSGIECFQINPLIKDYNGPEPTVDELRRCLSDVDVDVRGTSIATLTEVAPEGVGVVLAEALADQHSTVRQAAADGLWELVEVIPPSGELRDLLIASAAGADPEVRARSLELPRVLRPG